MKRKKKTPTERRESPNNELWQKDAGELFMKQFRGQYCAICGTSYNTCGHHIVSKKQSKSLRYDVRNILVLCKKHHKWGSDMAAHSDCFFIIQRFNDWFKENCPEQYEWTKANEHTFRKYTFKQALLNMKDNKLAWE